MPGEFLRRDTLEDHQPAYLPNAWLDYSPAELGQWVALLLKRSTHRFDRDKKAKDIHDARHYAEMLLAHIEAAENDLRGE